MKQFKKEEERRDNDTIKLLTSIYKVLLDKEKMKIISKAIADYDLEDKNYQYRTDTAIVESNLEDLKNVIDKIIKYDNATAK